MLGTLIAVCWWHLFYPSVFAPTQRAVEMIGDTGMIAVAAALCFYMVLSLGPLEAHFKTRFRLRKNFEASDSALQ